MHPEDTPDEGPPSATADPSPSAWLRSRLPVAIASVIALAFVATIVAITTTTASAPSDVTGAPPTTDLADGTEPLAPSPTPEPSADPSPEPAAPEDLDPLPGAGETDDDEPPAPPAPESTPEPDPPMATDEATPGPDGPGARLWGRWFRADHLRQGDEFAIVAGDQPLYVGFVREEGSEDLVWMTSCNTYGGQLTVGRDRLRIRGAGGTAVECRDEVLTDQEGWLGEFFGAGPHWRQLGHRLRLWTPDGRRIDLVEDRGGPPTS